MTPQQLKRTNLVFLEHDMLLKQNSFQKQHIKALNQIVLNDSIIKKDLLIKLNQQYKTINSLDKKITILQNQKKISMYVAGATIITLILVLISKKK